ncbi:MAG: stage V sporulation protein AD, partial [Clostridia bacterium]
MAKRLQNGTIILRERPSIIASAAVGGKKEGEGPLGKYFDYICDDGYFAQKTWEQAESEFQKDAFRRAVAKGSFTESDINYIFSGDLLNQCTASAFAHRASSTAYVGLYSACATFAEGLAGSALFINAGYADIAAACVSSHFATAERQYRYPMEYGGQRAPAAQWTVTGAGCAIIGKSAAGGPAITSVTLGSIVDAGICDANNMGAAMAPAAYDTISKVLRDTETTPRDYDLIVTGDLGTVGRDIVRDLFRMEQGIVMGDNYIDCGAEIFSVDTQDVHAGGSGAGCSASVFCGFLMNQ